MDGAGKARDDLRYRNRPEAMLLVEMSAVDRSTVLGGAHACLANIKVGAVLALE